MSDHEAAKPSAADGLFPKRGASRLLTLGLLFVAAVGIRLYRIEEPLLEIHASRQHHSAIVARAWYFEGNDSIPKWRQDVAVANRKMTGLREPPLMEFLAVLGYRVTGGERLWIPRLFSIAFWVAGAVFLHQLVRNIADADSALLSTAFYLLVPFGAFTSRVFMPDPLMTALLVAAVFLMWRYFERPTGRNFMVAAAASAFAVFVKSFCLFPLICVFVSLSVRKRGAPLRRIVLRSTLFATLVLAPALVYLLYTSLTAQARAILSTGRAVVQPSLLIRPFFWAGWLAKISQVVTLPALLAGVAGMVVFRKGLPRALVFGLWVGYMLFGLVLSYPAYTHSYYHLQLVPIVAISLGPVAALLMKGLARSISPKGLRRAFVRGLFLAVVFLAVFSYIYERRTLALRRFSAKQRRSQSFLYAVNPDFQDVIRKAREIGDAVGHSTKTLVISSYRIYFYHGELSGRTRPDLDMLRTGKRGGGPDLRAKEQFMTQYADWSPEYFVVMNLVELDARPDLKRFLNQNYPVLRRGDTYLIYDLRQSKSPP